MTSTLEAFVEGYAETGVAPMPLRAGATLAALLEVALPEVLITEAGRKEGRRAAREKAHADLYDFHSAELAAGIGVVLSRLDSEQVARDLVDKAAAHTAAGDTPVMRRRAVRGAALAAIASHLQAKDRGDLDTLNAAGWAHASAHGTAEAQATPAKGGPPDMTKVAAATAVALKAIPDSEAQAASAGWLDTQLSTVAMGAALAAGDGAALGDATRQVTQALLDTGRATSAYTDALHQTVNDTYVDTIRAAVPEALFDFVNGGPDPCDDCIEAALESPYEPADLPDCPAHPNCYCNIEQTTASVMAGAVG